MNPQTVCPACLNSRASDYRGDPLAPTPCPVCAVRSTAAGTAIAWAANWLAFDSWVMLEIDPFETKQDYAKRLCRALGDALIVAWERDCRENREDRATPVAPPAQPADGLVRYCPECGRIGEVPDGCRDCCPTGNAARYVRPSIAEQARRGFLAAAHSVPAQPADGWVMVPRVLTDDMVRAWASSEADMRPSLPEIPEWVRLDKDSEEAWWRWSKEQAARDWADFLAAAPAAPAAPPTPIASPQGRAYTDDERAAAETFRLNPLIALLALNHWLARDKSPAAPAAQPEGWIACAERMPEPGQTVLVKMDSWDFPRVLQYRDVPSRRFVDVHAGRWHWYPERTVWMPLPPAPKREGGASCG